MAPRTKTEEFFRVCIYSVCCLFRRKTRICGQGGNPRGLLLVAKSDRILGIGIFYWRLSTSDYIRFSVVQSKASTVSQYLKDLPRERRDEIQKVRRVIRKNIGKGFKETMNWGMICYEVPLSIYPDTYNGKPLMFVALAAQKNNYSLYLMCIYQDPRFVETLRNGFDKIGKKPNMGKSCIRFKRADDIPLDVIGGIVRRVSLEEFLRSYEQVKGS